VAYFKDTMFCGDPELQKPSVEIDQILVAGVFTEDLDFLAKFLGHQGTSANWLCVFCLTMHVLFKNTFTSVGTAPRFEKHSINSIIAMYQMYQEQFLSLPKNQ